MPEGNRRSMGFCQSLETRAQGKPDQEFQMEKSDQSIGSKSYQRQKGDYQQAEEGETL
jgi:hypothetical protein